MTALELWHSNNTGNIPGLNALRFFGAVSVVFLHIESYAFFVSMGWQTWHPLISGKTGVQLFYVISGFLITSLALDEISNNGNFNYLSFLQRRALRLFPLYYLAIAVIAALTFAGLANVNAGGFAYAMSYTYNMVPREHYNGLLGSFHTLGTEEQFYVLYGLLMWLGSRSGGAGLRASLVVGVLMGGLIWGPALGLEIANWLEPFKPHRILFNAMPPLIFGCLGAFCIKNRLVIFVLSRLSSNPALLMLVHLGLLFCFLYHFIGYAVAHRSLHLLSLGFVALLMDLHLFRNTFLSQLLEARPLVYLGSISYGIYVWQAVINGTGPNVRVINSPVLSTALVFAISVVSYELFEKRFLKMKRY